MDLLLDMKTIFISLVVGHLFTVVLISAYWKNYKKDMIFNIFFAAKCLQAAAWFFITLQGGIPNVLTISIANTLLFLGASLEAVAILKLRQAFGQKIKKIYVALTLINIVGFHFLILFYNVENIRIAFVSLGTAALVIAPTYQMFRGKDSSLLAKIIGCLYFFMFIFFVGRGIAAFSDSSMGLFTPGIIQTFAFLTLYLEMIMGNTGFILLVKEHVDKELLHMASTDDLTGVFNRRTFIQLTKKQLTVCANKRLPLSLVLFDVDHFKKINDTYGHVMGDRVLCQLTEQIRLSLRSDDLFGRYGGDEFAILLPGMSGAESTQYAQTIKQNIARAASQQLPMKYTLSMGLLTVLPDANTQWDTLYHFCDQALYRAKNNGRNQVYRSQ